jgi:hypothetical protein
VPVPLLGALARLRPRQRRLLAVHAAGLSYAEMISVTGDAFRTVDRHPCASRAGGPDRDYYRQAAERLGGTGAGLAVARKLLKRSYHTLRELGEEALAPA